MKFHEVCRTLVRVVPAMVLGMGLLVVGCEWLTGHKKTVLPPNPYPVLDSEQALVRTLEIAYHRLDFEKFQGLIPPPESANYLFLLSDVTPGGETGWGAAEEKHSKRLICGA